jgi:hypothetical protein
MRMSMAWQYFSFDEWRWHDLFGGGMPAADRAVISSAVWDDCLDEDLPDPEDDYEKYVDALIARAPSDVLNLCKRICRDGISYSGISEKEAALLDRVIVGFFCPEGLEAALGFSYESKDGLRWSAIEALHSRAKPKERGGLFSFAKRHASKAESQSVAPVLWGRRYGTNEKPVDEIYFVLSAKEVPLVLAEVKALLANGDPWSQPALKASIEDELVQALESANRQGRALAGRFS